MKRLAKRRYDATTRRESAAEARERIIAAASQLFAKNGIDQVTVAQIAKRARVSTALVYSRFKSKAGLLEALAHSVLLGPSYQSAAKQAESLDTPEAALRLTARIACGVYRREHEEMSLVRGAVAYSPALKKLDAGLENTRRVLQEKRARLVFRSNPALRELGLEKVRDVIWSLTSRDLYRMLVVERGWTPEAYEQWLAETLIRTLSKGA
jgi:AcrR family transcriptional regulator